MNLKCAINILLLDFVWCFSFPLHRPQYIRVPATFSQLWCHLNTLPYIIVHLCNTFALFRSDIICRVLYGFALVVQHRSRKIKHIHSKFYVCCYVSTVSLFLVRSTTCLIICTYYARYWCVISWIISCFATDMHKYFPQQRWHNTHSLQRKPTKEATLFNVHSW